MSDHIAELKRRQAKVDALTPEQIERRTRHLPKPEFVYFRKHDPFREPVPDWLEDREDYLSIHYDMTLRSGQLQLDLDTDGLACGRLSCIYDTARSTVRLALDVWHNPMGKPDAATLLAIRELVSIRVNAYVQEYLRHFRHGKSKADVVKAILMTYPDKQDDLVAGKLSRPVFAEFILEKTGMTVTENTIRSTLRDLKLIK